MCKPLIMKKVKSSKVGSKNNEDTQSLQDEYYKFYDKYKQESGEGTPIAVLMETGNFYQTFSPHDLSKANAEEISQALNLKLVQKKQGYYMCGFPNVEDSNRHIQSLIDQGYRVIFVTQEGNETDKSTNRIPRKVTRIISKDIDPETKNISSNIVSIYVEQYSKGLFSFGISVTDTILSNTIYYNEIHSIENDLNFSIDSITKQLLQCNPVKYIVTTKNTIKLPMILKYLNITNCQHYDVQHLDVVVPSIYEYSITALRKYLNSSFINTENFIIESWNSSEYVDLCSTTAKQLDLFLFYKRPEINKTLTNMGNRLFFQRLFNPIFDKNELEKRYDEISKFTDKREVQIVTLLKGLHDLAKLHKKMSVGQLTWDQWSLLHKNYTKLNIFFDNDDDLHKKVNFSFVEDYKKDLELDTEDNDENDYYEENDEDEYTEDEKIEKKDKEILRFVFKRGYNEDLTNFYDSYQVHCSDIDSFKSVCTSIVKSKKPINWKEKDTLGIIVTKSRLDKIKESKLIGEKIKTIDDSKTIVMYTNKLKLNLLGKEQYSNKIKELTKNLFTNYQIIFWNTWKVELEKLSDIIAKLDVLQCAYKMKKKFKLTRPTFSTSNQRCLDITNARHILIELINQETIYIPNDLNFNSDEKTGMILYGVNSCGKTSFLKSIGLIVILAQAGFFVPVDNMIFTPVKRIMTRIAGGDNIEKSQSSFIIEMEELKSILYRAKPESKNECSTLVLGDEICKGTDFESALGLVYATVKKLVEYGTFFIFATHLHKLAKDIPTDNVYVKHMKVTFVNGSAIYDRKIVDGQGIQLYGLEIATDMNLPKDFLQLARDYRLNHGVVDNEDDNQLMTSSRYNSKMILTKCQVPDCGYYPKNNRMQPLETHHRNFQCNADDTGYHGTQHKNALHNLIALCRPCHNDLHLGKFTLEYQDTIHGRKIIKK